MRALLLLAWLTTAGCGPDPAIEFELIPDTDINTEVQILEVVDTLVVVVDTSPAVVYTHIWEDSTRPGVTYNTADRDGDDELELVATFPLRGTKTLPHVRLERGILPAFIDVDVDFIGRGRIPGDIAVGAVRGVELNDTGQIRFVPFNMQVAFLPPKVVGFSPPDGGMIPTCELESVLVMFSKDIDPGSAPGATITMNGVAPTLFSFPVPRELNAEFDGIVGSGGRLQFRAIIGGLMDPVGRVLDQEARELVQDFDSTFEVSCPDTLDAGGRGPPPPAAESPAPCRGVTCFPGFVCSEMTELCEADCRLYGGGICPPELPACDDETGLCGPSADGL